MVRVRPADMVHHPAPTRKPVDIGILTVIPPELDAVQIAAVAFTGTSQVPTRIPALAKRVPALVVKRHVFAQTTVTSAPLTSKLVPMATRESATWLSRENHVPQGQAFCAIWKGIAKVIVLYVQTNLVAQRDAMVKDALTIAGATVVIANKAYAATWNVMAHVNCAIGKAEWVVASNCQWARTFQVVQTAWCAATRASALGNRALRSGRRVVRPSNACPSTAM